MDPQVIDEAHENAVRMWHSMGLTKDREDGQGTVHDHDADTVNALKEELLEAARDSVVGARGESGADPTIVDGVLRDSTLAEQTADRLRQEVLERYGADQHRNRR